MTEEAGFTKAAARLHVAQPGVSAQIRQLERELGQPLLDRSGRTVRLTEVGAAVLPYARAALAAVEGARLAVDELTGLLRGHVTIGTIDWIRSLDLPGMLAGFHRDHPDVEITVVQEDSATLTEGLRTGRIDLAFLSLGAARPRVSRRGSSSSRTSSPRSPAPTRWRAGPRSPCGRSPRRT
ncbi:LysR family transcriptional regulator [Actinomadura luteofluorescens]|uniref:LysR family transcriptional regulator n=1 Tax=Actinomadura luteofluorescens TaxID=46163 RepID=UPI00362E1BF5